MDKDDLEKTKEIDTITDISDEKLEEDCEVIDDDKTIVGDKIVEENIVNDKVLEDNNDDKENKSKCKKKIIIILSCLIVLLLLIWLCLDIKKNKDKEKIKDDVYNQSELSEKEKENKIKSYGEKLEKVISDYYKENNVLLSYDEALKLIKNDDDISCSIHEIYDDGGVYLSDCSFGGKKTKYSYGEKRQVNEPTEIVEDNTKINVYINKSTGKATLTKPTNIKDYDIYVVDCGRIYQNATLFENTQYVLYQTSDYYMQLKNYVTNKKILENVSYKAILPFKNKDSYDTKYLAVLIDNKWGIYNLDTGKVIVAASFDGFSIGSNNNSTTGPMEMITPVKNNLVIAYKGQKYGVVDYTSGVEVIPFNYSNISKVGDYLYASVEYGLDGVIYDLDGKLVIDKKYNNIYGITNGNYILVNKDNRIVLVNISGRVLFDFGDATGLDKLNFMIENNGELLFQFHIEDDVENCKEYIYNLSTGKGSTDEVSCGGIG